MLCSILPGEPLWDCTNPLQSFMLVGHTKFAPDWCFGLLKQRYRKTYVSSLQDIVDIVNKSADVNTAQLVGTQEGEILVQTYSWSTFLGSYFRRIPNITSYHHFTLSSTYPGSVSLKLYSDSDSSMFEMVQEHLGTKRN